jgi:hypothetical protein
MGRGGGPKGTNGLEALDPGCKAGILCDMSDLAVSHASGSLEARLPGDDCGSWSQLRVQGTNHRFI